MFKSKRGRPSASQSEAISHSILEAATSLFLTEGFERTSMEAVAKTAGVPKSTLYKRHSDKKHLLKAALESRIVVWGSGIRTASEPPPTTLEEALLQQLISVLNWTTHAEVRAFSRLAMGNGEGASIVSGILHSKGYTAVVANLSRAIEEFTRKDKRPAKNPDQVAAALMALLTGWVASRPLEQAISAQEAQDFADQTVKLLVEGRSAW